MSGNRRKWAEPHQQLPADVAARLRGMRRYGSWRYKHTVLQLRTAGWGVPCLADALHSTPAAVAQLIQRAKAQVAAGTAPTARLEFPLPVPAVGWDAHPRRGTGRFPALPAVQAQRLRELQIIRHSVPWWWPGEHAGYRAARDLAELVAKLHADDYTLSSMARAMGVTFAAVQHLLDRFHLRSPEPAAVQRLLRRTHQEGITGHEQDA